MQPEAKSSRFTQSHVMFQMTQPGARNCYPFPNPSSTSNPSPQLRPQLSHRPAILLLGQKRLHWVVTHACTYRKWRQSLLLSSSKNTFCLVLQKKIHCKHQPAGTLKRTCKVPEHLNRTQGDLLVCNLEKEVTALVM